MSTVRIEESSGNNPARSVPLGSTTAANSAPPEADAALPDIHTATAAGDRAAVRLQLARGISPGAVSAEGWAPMHLAAAKGDLRTMELLLSAGAAPDQPSTAGCATPLHCAVASGCAEATALLLARGATPDRIDAAGLTPLHLAALRGETAVLRTLLKAGADPRATASGRTPLALARSARHHDAAALLAQVM